MDTISSFLLFLIFGVVTVVGWFLKDTPALLRELKVEKFRGDNETNLQIESYFREVSGKDLNEILQKWSTIIDDLNNESMSKKQVTKHMKDLTTKTFMYGSPRTTKILGFMQQLSYENIKIESQPEVNFGKPKDKKTDYRLIVYTSFIIASLKEDFTGYEIGPLDFLRLRLTDFSNPEINEQIKEAEKEILEKLKEEGVRWGKG